MKIKNEHSPKFIGTGCSYLIVLLKQRRFFSKFTCASLIPEIFPNKKGGGQIFQHFKGEPTYHTTPWAVYRQVLFLFCCVTSLAII